MRPQEIAVLADQSLTYEDVGATRTTPPRSYRRFITTRRLAPTADFDRSRASLLTWQVQQRSGLRLAVSVLEIAEGATAVMWLGAGPLSVRIPNRVVYVVDETDRVEFAYGTLPGHPESGEEAFKLHRRPDGRIDFTITAFSRPATLLSKAGGPMTTAVQRMMTRRYLRALDDPPGGTVDPTGRLPG